MIKGSIELHTKIPKVSLAKRLRNIFLDETITGYSHCSASYSKCDIKDMSVYLNMPFLVKHSNKIIYNISKVIEHEIVDCLVAVIERGSSIDKIKYFNGFIDTNEKIVWNEL